MVPIDSHFYIDHAPPAGIVRVLEVLSLDQAMNLEEIAEKVPSTGKARFRSEWPKRLSDLGLADVPSRRPLQYTLSVLGQHVRRIGQVDKTMVADLLHYLHSNWLPDSDAPSYAWSYLACSRLAWHEGRFLGTRPVASRVLQQMREEFTELDWTARTGSRFDATAVGRWLQWVQALEPQPFLGPDLTLVPRSVVRHELILLSLDRVYRQRGYRFGDPVLLDETLLDEVASVFFLDSDCCRQLVELAARLTRAVRLSETFAGTAITLLEPYTVDRI